LVSWPISVTSALAGAIFSTLRFILHAHVVFVAKYRHQVFSSRHLERMEQIMRDVYADFGCELAGFNGEPGTSTCW
jgi:REP element-mobilizing transposase RayT